MTLYDFLFCVERVKNLEDAKSDYRYWTMDEEQNILLISANENSGIFIDSDKFDLYGIDIFLYELIEKYDYFGYPMFIPYEEFEPYHRIEIEIKSQVYWENFAKYPIVCARGTCDKQCDKESAFYKDFYCFHEFPCMNNRPDWNVWSCKYPNFYDLLFDAVKFIDVCPHTDTLIVMFEFTPDSDRPELYFGYSTGLLVKENKITIIGDQDTESLYQEYNAKYPTCDRKLEQAISEPERNFYFRF